MEAPGSSGEIAYGTPVPGDVASLEFGEGRSKSKVRALIRCSASPNLEPKKAKIEVLETDFFSSLVKGLDGRYFFSGILDGWPGYSLLELTRLQRLDKSVIWEAESMNFSQKKRKRETLQPGFPKDAESIIAILHKPKWSDIGFCKGIPGHVWYYSGAQNTFEDRKVAVGTQIMKAARELDEKNHGKPSRAIKVYLFCYRFARSEETFLQRQFEYHHVVFLEWDHGKFGTIVEFARRHGVSGFNGKCDWVEDRNELFMKMPAECKVPWEVKNGECRVNDIACRNIQEFKAYLKREPRFVDPISILTRRVALKKNTKAEIFEVLMNRMMHSNSFTTPTILHGEPGNNCWTFGHSFFAYLTNVQSKHTRRYNIYYKVKWFGISYKDKKYYPPEYNESENTEIRASL